MGHFLPRELISTLPQKTQLIFHIQANFHVHLAEFLSFPNEKRNKQIMYQAT